MSVTPLGTHTVTQIGIIVRNLEETVQAWSRRPGECATEILVPESVGRTHAEHQGRPTPALAKLAFFQLGQVTLELIEPMGEPSTWQDQLVRHGQSLHPIAFEVKGMVERLEMLAQQSPPVLQRRGYPGGRS